MKKTFYPKQVSLAVYATIMIIVVTAWLQSRSWNLTGLRPYQFFSLLGLVAFGTMLTHYITALLYDLYHQKQERLEAFYRVTSLIVFACILLHPVLVVLNLKALGFGLPPSSYKAFYGRMLIPYILLGIVAWASFLAFEMKESLSKTVWWKYVLISNDIAMLAIVIHGFKLGTVLSGVRWFRTVWIVFALLLAMCLVNKYFFRKNTKSIE